MKTLFLFLFLPLLLTAETEFFGYFESEADLQQLGKTRYAFGYNKLRLDLEARPAEQVLIGMNVNVQRFWGQTTWNLLDFLPETAWQPLFENPLVPGEYLVSEVPFTIPDTVLLDNFYLRIGFNRLDLTVGRQQISPGVGYTWNPMDIFNARTLLDPAYEQTGVNVIRAELTLADRLILEGILKPSDTWDSSIRQYILKTGWGAFDLALTQAAYPWQRTRMLSVVPVLLATQRDLIGLSAVGELLGWGVWMEGTRNHLVDDTVFHEIVLGADHTFDNSLYILLEGLHNEAGATQIEDLLFENYLQAFNGETRSLMQDYVFVYASHPTFDLVSFSAMALANLNDQSGTLAPQVDWNVREDTNLSIQGSFFWGADNTEFGLQDWGLCLQLISNF
jgi:hypothetical protein